MNEFNDSSITSYDPLELNEHAKQIVVMRRDSIEERKYYRFRGGKWYGGIATADAVGCNMKCKFCWSWKPRDMPTKYGSFLSPNAAYERLRSIIERRGYDKVRISGGEPTISRGHLSSLIELFTENRVNFILETNGILIGSDKRYAEDLSRFSNLHVRVSIKGVNEEEFTYLTGARPSFFSVQLRALKNLLDYGVSCHPAVMLSFSPEDGLKKISERLEEIDERLISDLEEEYVFLYPHVVELLRRHGLKPRVSYYPDEIRREFI